MAQMAKVIDRDAAAINARLSWLERNERVGAAGKGVSEPQGHDKS